MSRKGSHLVGIAMISFLLLATRNVKRRRGLSNAAAGNA